jgi:hypothetical protein
MQLPNSLRINRAALNGEVASITHSLCHPSGYGAECIRCHELFPRTRVILSKSSRRGVVNHE